MENIRIAIADDEALFRKGMKLILNGYPGMQVDIEAENGVDLLHKLKLAAMLPDILLLDLKMPEMNGIEVAKVIRTEYPSVKIIVLSTHFSRAFIINMIELSAVAYLPKNSQPQEVAETIEQVHSKGFHYNNEVMAIIRQNIISKQKPKAHFSFDLTPREVEILQLICEQYTAPEIAEKLFISPRTVDGHRNNLLSKLNCKNVAGLVVFALQNEIVKISKIY
ncbi:response regulator transcription factor [Aureisphaera galaxeae]|uniref:response regulator transcription factor n=1 Tax=Aureisphaera galaxeae TaxID=1538023 RepID=UPI00235081A6|nr:response regulator transcription factor [Aureisphaera galaxeae]MDC8003609.1 response regulator transcription factor [Aureisphaera galaxeae]